MTITLVDLVTNLKNELRAAANAGKADPMFSLKGASIKTKVVVADKREGGGKIEFYIASANLSAGSSTTSEHEITIELGPIDPSLLMGEPD
jgi:hypothetical protein